MKIRIGGVPEHFNYPWQLLTESTQLKKEGVEIEWTDYPGGTGAMCSSLEDDELDMAVVLTEGIVKSILQGNPSKILSFYVYSPLIWGIHVSQRSKIRKLEELDRPKYAISSYGSGSHLMAMIDAKIREKAIHESQFVQVFDLDGARRALKNGKADVFFWEKYTTSPFVESFEFARIAERPSPWPCFVIAVAPSFLKANQSKIGILLKALQKQCDDIKNSSESYQEISQVYDLPYSMTMDWLNGTRWRISQKNLDQVLHTVQLALLKFGMTKAKLPTDHFIATP
ncbi:MAG: hypothetical protein KDD52_07105 [Bdellovibrionales bacterium]|nr:hypothetical protein [Bdellovibrionales bacterium]